METQHIPKDIIHIIKQSENYPDKLLLGSRKDTGKMPLRSRFGNILTRYIFNLITNNKITDTQTGLRLIPRKYLEEFLPKIDVLKIFFNEENIKFICRSSRYNRNMIRPLWHMIFISSWYLLNIKKVKTNGNFFDMISSSV